MFVYGKTYTARFDFHSQTIDARRKMKDNDPAGGVAAGYPLRSVICLSTVCRDTIVGCLWKARARACILFTVQSESISWSDGLRADAGGAI